MRRTLGSELSRTLFDGLNKQTEYESKLAICEHAYIVSEGAVIAEGTPQEVLENDTVRKVYLGEDFTV